MIEIAENIEQLATKNGDQESAAAAMIPEGIALRGGMLVTNLDSGGNGRVSLGRPAPCGLLRSATVDSPWRCEVFQEAFRTRTTVNKQGKHIESARRKQAYANFLLNTQRHGLPNGLRVQHCCLNLRCVAAIRTIASVRCGV